MLPGVVGPKSGKSGKAGRKPSLSGRQRLALVVFGALFILLFVIFAIAEGIGQPSVPSGDAALVQGVPSELGGISEDEFNRAFERQTKGKAPKPGEAKYEEAQQAALGELIDGVWIQGEAEELGITVTPKQIAGELKTIKEQSFKTKGSYQEFLKESHFTQKEVNERVKIRLLETKIQEKVSKEAPKPSAGEIKNYYEAEKARQFTTPASRDVRVIFNKDKAKVAKATAELEKDHSPAGWKKAAAKYSSDPTTKSKGGLQEGITEEFVRGALKEAIFGSPPGQLVGPVEYEGNHLVLEVVKLNPAKVKSLKEVESQIEQTRTQEMQQEYFSEFVNSWQAKWRTRTYCGSSIADGIGSAQARDELSKRCANVSPSGHPAGANPACYESNPKEPAKECPSIVTPNTPALPGSVTEFKPKGEPFPQRPHPEAPTGVPSTESIETTPPPTGK